MLVELANGAEKAILADSVVTTLPQKPNTALADEIREFVGEVYAVGECNPLLIEDEYPPLASQPMTSKAIWPRYTINAIREAYRVARAL